MDKFEPLPEFSNHFISNSGKQIIFKSETTNISIPILNNCAMLRHDTEKEAKSYNICDLVALAYHKIPLNGYKIFHKDQDVDNNHCDNLIWKRIDKDYSDIDFIVKSNILFVKLDQYYNVEATSDGHIIDSFTRQVIKEFFTGNQLKVKLPLAERIGKERRKMRTVAIVDIIASSFLVKPRDATDVRFKNNLSRDLRCENLEWICHPILKPLKSFPQSDFNQIGIKTNEDGENEKCYENIEEDDKDQNENIEEDNKDQNENVDEDDDFYTDIKSHILSEHEPIYEEFELSDVEYNLDDCYEMEGKMWKIAQYKGHALKYFAISEDMKFYSKKKRKILNDNEIKLTRRGEQICKCNINGKSTTIYLRDILASTFLKTPKNSVVSVHRKWNKDNNTDKYDGQTNHYTNVQWLTEDDFVDCGTCPETGNIFRISKNGDGYSVTANGTYLLLKQKHKKNGLRQGMFGSSRKDLHLLVANAFLKKPDETYKFVVHKDGDLSNTHYRNLVWLNTLSGIHNDGVRYYSIPKCSNYALSETNLPYSFQFGILSPMKIINSKRYRQITLTTDMGEKKTLRYHKLVAATRNKDFDPKKVVDHIDKDKTHEQHTNLRSLTLSENRKNTDYKYSGRKIIQIDTNGNIINTYLNAEEASIMNRCYKHAIQKCARNNENNKDEVHKYNGFIWKYSTEKEKYICKEGEIFKRIIGDFQGIILEYGNYMISNYGTLIDIKKGHAKSHYIAEYDYPTVSLHNENGSLGVSIHKLIGLIFVSGRSEECNEINHLDEDIYNFRADNLKWVSHVENIKYSAYKQGKPVKKICMKTGNILGVYDSRIDGARSCGFERSVDISYVCSGERKSAYGYFWENILFDEIELYPELKINQMRAIKNK